METGKSSGKNVTQAPSGNGTVTDDVTFQGFKRYGRGFNLPNKIWETWLISQ